MVRETRSRSEGKVSQSLRHPLILLLLGTLLGSYLLPVINGRAERARRLEELRVQRTLAAIEANDRIDQSLNLVLTAFESFWHYGDLSKTARHELRANVEHLYEEFNRTGWWWFDQSLNEERLLGLLDERAFAQAKGIAVRYNQTLAQTKGSLDAAWTMCLYQEPLPERKTAEEALARARGWLQAYRGERYRILSEYTTLLLKPDR